jgi:starch-binding outer membrane protein, SusD/RagB family
MTTTMRTTRAHRRLRLVSLALLAAGAGACSDFLTGEGLTENPNNPIDASPLQLLVASQVSLFNQQEGQLARLAAMYTQQLAGTNNQQRDYGASYLLTEGDVTAFWNQTYVGGGLIDLRRVQAAARAAGDDRTRGIALVLEALRVGTATSLWGDIPYAEAVGTVATPRLDPQQEVYAAVQERLDTAIALLATGEGPGPGTADVIYGGDAARWTQAAWTLKARFHLHTAERLGVSAFSAALAAAANGISAAPTTVAQAIHGGAPGDLRALHGNTTSDGNVWGQFFLSRPDIYANQQFVDLLRRRNDPRLGEYFDPVTVGGAATYQGANQFGVSPAGGASPIDGAVRRQFTYRQPIVTWTENQLIRAEAHFRLGDAAAALAEVNVVRQAVGLTPLPGPVTLEQIAEEKYVALFQNIEVYNDWKRLCVPRLSPGGAGGQPSPTGIPGRLPYPVGERNTNPNVPKPGDAPLRNWNDPQPCA